MQIKVERGVLPQSHPKRPRALLEECAIDVQQNAKAATQRVHDYLSKLAAEEREWTEGTLIAAGVHQNVNCSHISDVCVAAHLVDFCVTRWRAETEAAPEWHNLMVSVAQSWLTRQTVDAEPDSLLDVAEVQ
jgi:hypothetical protein